MAGKLDQLLVIDVELTCWDGSPPDGEAKEIIEIGICTLDVASGECVSKQSILVRPEHSRISPFCADLTHLTQAEVERDGMPFARASAILRRKYQARDRIWASYGDYDRRQFERQCDERNVLYPFGPSYLNVKTLFAVFNGLPEEVGLITALELMRLPPNGIHHRGADDAWNTARLLAALMQGCRAGQMMPGAGALETEAATMVGVISDELA